MIITLANLPDTSVSFTCGMNTDGEILEFQESDFTIEELTTLQNFANLIECCNVIIPDTEDCMDITLNIPSITILNRSIVKVYADETTENKALIDSVKTLLISKVA